MTPERALLAAAAAAMREELMRHEIRWPPAGQPLSADMPLAVHIGLDETPVFIGPAAACRAFIDQRAFAAGVRSLAAAEPTPAMVKAWLDSVDARPAIADLRAMLNALLTGSEG